MITKKNLLAIPIICLFAVFCGADDQKPANKTIAMLRDTTNILRDLPDGTGKGSVLASIQLICDSLQLDRLENGFDSLQLRFWFRYTGEAEHQILIIKKQQTDWSATYGTFTPITDEEGKLKGFSKQLMGKKPFMPWPTLIDSLVNLDVLKLRDRKKIQDYPAIYNADLVTVEVATTKSYRLYQYSAIKESALTINEAKSMEKIVQLLTEQFQFRMLKPL